MALGSEPILLVHSPTCSLSLPLPLAPLFLGPPGHDGYGQELKGTRLPGSAGTQSLSSRAA